MYKKLFGYSPGAFVRLVIDDYQIPVSPGYVSFIAVCVGPLRKTWWLGGGVPNAKGSKIGRLLYVIYSSREASKDFIAYWHGKDFVSTKSA